MIDLPKSTIVDRFLAKEKFYKRASINNKVKQLFTDEIDRITWLNKISPDTLNISADKYNELQIIGIKLKTSDISTQVLKTIDNSIPYPIIFIIQKHNSYQAAACYKPATNAKNEKASEYFRTPWQQGISLELKGNSVDEIYKNYLTQINPDLNSVKTQDISAAIIDNKQINLLKKQAESINRQIHIELSHSKRQDLARKRHEIELQIKDML